MQFCCNLFVTISDHLSQFIIVSNVPFYLPSTKPCVYKKYWSNIDQINCVFVYYSIDWDDHRLFFDEIKTLFASYFPFKNQ